MLTLTNEQQLACEAIADWLATDKQTFALAGYAGTGKTTVVASLLDALPTKTKPVVVAPTGKAAHVLTTKGVPAMTIHRFCYQCRGEDDEGNPLFDFLGVGDVEDLLVIVDESSMVDGRIYRDLLSTGARLLFIGDHGQLAPVGEDPGIMRNADFKLETVLRQAGDSPILDFAHRVRIGWTPKLTYESGTVDVCVIQSAEADEFLSGFDKRPDVYLCGTNKVRCFLNEHKRTKANLEQVVVLRNNYSQGVFNGQVFECEVLDRNAEGHPYMGLIEGRRRFFDELGWLNEKPGFGGDMPEDYILADYGYALTVHKSQGSEWDHVVVYADKNWGSDIERWKYTAATRARKRLTWILP